MKASFSSSVLVVGAGPVGLVAALALRAKGLPALVLEAEPKGRSRPGSRATYLYQESLDVLDELAPGLGQSISKAGVTWPTIRTTFQGRTVYERTFPPAPPGSFGAGVSQREQEKLMYDAAVAAGVEFLWDSAVSEIESSEAGVVITTVDGRRLDTDYVIAADGARSAVRNSLNIEMSGPRSDSTFIIVDVKESEDDPLPLARVFNYKHPAVGGRNVLMVPFRDGWRLDLQTRPGDDIEAMQALDGVQRWVSAVIGPRYRDRIDWISSYRFNQAVADSFVDPHNRIMLAGEAAHLFAPFGGGRGLNSGIPDAVAAAEAIADAIAHGGDAAARRTLQRAADTRRAAGHFNAAAAGQALEQMEAIGMKNQITQRVAAYAARYWEKPGRWLDGRVTSGTKDRFSASTRF